MANAVSGYSVTSAILYIRIEKPTGQEEFASILSGMVIKQVNDAKDWFKNRGGKG